VHIGGKSALSLRGVFHYLALGKEKLFLYGLMREKTPEWLTHQFAVERRTNRLFGNEGKVENRFQVNRLNDAHSRPLSRDQNVRYLNYLLMSHRNKVLTRS